MISISNTLTLSFFFLRYKRLKNFWDVDYFMIFMFVIEF